MRHAPLTVSVSPADRITMAVSLLRRMSREEQLTVIAKIATGEFSEYRGSDDIHDGVESIREDIASEPCGATECLYPRSAVA